MKKILGIILGLCMIFTVAGNASAFEIGSLTEVIYTINPADNTGSAESAAELGNVGSIDFFNDTTFTNTANTPFNLGVVAPPYEPFPTYLAFFSSDNINNEGYIALTTPTLAGVNANNFLSFLNGGNLFYANVGGPSETQYTGFTAFYENFLNQGGTNFGGFSSFNLDPAAGYADISDLTAGQSVEMYLYQFSGLGDDFRLISGDGTDYIATLTYNYDGSVDFSGNAVPIPGSLLLLGSGILGLFAIRRRNK